MSQSVDPFETLSPIPAVRLVITPDLWATNACSIFIASRTMIKSPGST